MNSWSWHFRGPRNDRAARWNRFMATPYWLIVAMIRIFRRKTIKYEVETLSNNTDSYYGICVMASSMRGTVALRSVEVSAPSTLTVHMYDFGKVLIFARFWSWKLRPHFSPLVRNLPIMETSAIRGAWTHSTVRRCISPLETVLVGSCRVPGWWRALVALGHESGTTTAWESHVL